MFDVLFLLAPGAGAALFAIIVVWCHVRRPDISPATQGVSHYAVGSTDAVMAVGFLALAGALFLAALIVRPGNLLVLASAGMMLVAATPMSASRVSSLLRALHTFGALVFFVCSAVGAVIASIDHQWLFTIAAALTIGVVLFLASMVDRSPLARVRGWLQRAAFALIVIWVMAAPLLE